MAEKKKRRRSRSTKRRNSGSTSEFNKSFPLDEKIKQTEKSTEIQLTARVKAGLPLTKTKPIFSSKSRHVFVGCGSDVKVFSATSGDCVKSLEGHRDTVIAVCQDPTAEDSVVSCDRLGNVIFWNSNSRKEQIFHPSEGQYVSHFALLSELEFIIGSGFPSKPSKLFFCRKGRKESRLTANVCPNLNAICIGNNKNYLCASLGVDLFSSYYPFDGRESCTKYHKMPHKLTCVQCHPSKDLVAVGDVIGCVTLLYGLYNDRPVRQKLHWHTLPVGDLSFSNGGMEIFSGGGESVCVRWNYENGTRKFLPRLGSPIVYIAVDRGNDYTISSHIDNSISLFNAREFRLEGLIQELSLHILEKGSDGRVLPAGLHVQPTSNCLVLNGRRGQLQFFDFYSSKLLYHLDITLTNLASDERHESVASPDVTHVAICPNGLWMITCELCRLTKNYTDIKLKVWKFDESNQVWELSTCILQPHETGVNSICMSDPLSEDNLPLCISCGNDGKIRQWRFFSQKHGTETADAWLCTATEEFSDLIPSICKFSPDSSILAVSFANYLSIWQSDSMSLLGTFSTPVINQDIKLIEFSLGSKPGCFVVTCTEKWLYCWNVLSCSLLYRIELSVFSITTDPLSSIMAVFGESKAFLFDPLQCICKAIGNIDMRRAGPVVGALFMPPAGKPKLNTRRVWKSNYELCFMDKNQVLYKIEEKLEESAKTRQINEDIDLLLGDSHWSKGSTAFSKMADAARKDDNEKSFTLVEEIDYVSPDSMLKAFTDIQVYNIDSFPTLITKHAKIPPAPGSASYELYEQNIPKYSTFGEDNSEEANRLVDGEILLTGDIFEADFTKWFEDEN